LIIVFIVILFYQIFLDNSNCYNLIEGFKTKPLPKPKPLPLPKPKPLPPPLPKPLPPPKPLPIPKSIPPPISKPTPIPTPMPIPQPIVSPIPGQSTSLLSQSTSLLNQPVTNPLPQPQPIVSPIPDQSTSLPNQSVTITPTNVTQPPDQILAQKQEKINNKQALLIEQKNAGTIDVLKQQIKDFSSLENKINYLNSKVENLINKSSSLFQTQVIEQKL
jgi:hypothetical protein